MVQVNTSSKQNKDDSYTNKPDGRFFLYRIYYYRNGDGERASEKDDAEDQFLAFIGHAYSDIDKYLRNSFFHKGLVKTHADINRVSKMEITVCDSEADMLLYEIYYINLLKPAFNAGNKADDELNLTFPELEWHQYTPAAFDFWKTELGVS